jgi:hypothetical protein
MALMDEPVWRGKIKTYSGGWVGAAQIAAAGDIAPYPF